MRPGSEGKKDSKKPQRSQTLSTSVEQLLTKRAEQAQTLAIVNVGGRDFYVTPQGGATGALVFLSKDKVDNRTAESARELRPDLYVELAKLDDEGRAATIEGKRHLGAVYGKDYHLVYDVKTTLWHVMEGPGDDKPKPAPKPEPKLAASAASPDDAPGRGDVSAAAAAPPTVSELENGLLAEGWKKAEADMAEMDVNLRAKYRLLSRRDPELGLEYNVLGAPEAVAPEGWLLYTHWEVRSYRVGVRGPGKSRSGVLPRMNMARRLLRQTVPVLSS